MAMLSLFLALISISIAAVPATQAAGIVIDVQPFSDVSTKEKTYVFEALKKVYPNVEMKEAIGLPKAAYYPARKRYRADSLIDFLGARTVAGHVALGITTKDISATKGAVKDWGIMGLGFLPGNACVVSTFRLSKTETLDQLFKISIHELGHTQGLPHCPVKFCFMRDAEGHNPTNEETDFCPSCKAHLVARGWKFK